MFVLFDHFQSIKFILTLFLYSILSIISDIYILYVKVLIFKKTNIYECNCKF